MENLTPASPWLNPTFLLVAGTSIIALIAWFIRGEFKSSANTQRLQDHEEADEKWHNEHEAMVNDRIKRVEDNAERIKIAFYRHAGDATVHHNEAMFNEFRTGLERRFTHIDASLQEILRKIDRGDVDGPRK